MAWTAERIELLKGYAAKGLSTGQIAARLGVPRNAVCGKLHRMKNPSGAKPSPRRTRAPGDQPPSPSPQGLDHSQPRDIKPLASDPPEHERVDLLDLKHGQCKWGIGYPAMFCGRPTCDRGSGSYCSNHADRAFAGTGRKPWTPDDSRRAAFAARARRTFNVLEDA